MCLASQLAPVDPFYNIRFISDMLYRLECRPVRSSYRPDIMFINGLTYIRVDRLFQGCWTAWIGPSCIVQSHKTLELSNAIGEVTVW